MLCASESTGAEGSIVTQSLYTLYTVGLNMILKLFSEVAVTVLGIYYKIQSFFHSPAWFPAGFATGGQLYLWCG